MNVQVYVHDQHSNLEGHTHTWVENMHVPPILPFWIMNVEVEGNAKTKNFSLFIQH